MSRSHILARLDCQVNTDCTVTKGKPSFIEIETRFNDGSIARARGGDTTKRYELNAQLKSRDDGFIVSYGGQGVTMRIKEATRFNARTLANLPITAEQIQCEVEEVCALSGIRLSEKGEAQLALLIEQMQAAA